MTLDYESVKNLSAEQKQAISLILSDIEETEPMGPGISVDYVKEIRETLSLKKPSESQLYSFNFYKKLLELSGKITFKVHDVLDIDGNPVVTITGSLQNLESIID